LESLCASNRDWGCITLINFATSHIGANRSGCTYDQVKQFILDDLGAEPDWPLQIERECDHLVVGGDSSPHVFSLGELWMLAEECEFNSFELKMTCREVIEQAAKNFAPIVGISIGSNRHCVNEGTWSCSGELDEKYISLCSYTKVLGFIRSRIWEEPEWPMTIRDECG